MNSTAKRQWQLKAAASGTQREDDLAPTLATPPQGAIDHIDHISPLQGWGRLFDETQGGRCGALPLRSALGWSVVAFQALRCLADHTNPPWPGLDQREAPEEGRLAIIAGGTESNANRGFAETLPAPAIPPRTKVADSFFAPTTKRQFRNLTARRKLDPGPDGLRLARDPAEDIPIAKDGAQASRVP